MPRRRTRRQVSLYREESSVQVLEVEPSLPAHPLRLVLGDDPANLGVLLDFLGEMRLLAHFVNILRSTLFNSWSTELFGEQGNKPPIDLSYI